MYVDDPKNPRFDVICEDIEIKPQARDRFACCVCNDSV